MKALVKMKAIRWWCLVIGLCLLLTAPVVTAQKATVIKIATLAPEGSSWIRTLKELNTVEDSLVKSLTAVYHGRVKYPDQQTA